MGETEEQILILSAQGRSLGGQRPLEPTLQEQEHESELVVCRNITETLLLAYV